MASGCFPSRSELFCNGAMDRRVFLAAASWFAVGVATGRALPNAAPRRIRLHNAHTGESFDGPYRDEHGPIAAAMEDLSHLLRDHHSGQRIAIDVGVVDFLATVMDGVGASRATVLSAYRTVATNRMLAKTTFGVADNSQHIYGRALDIRLDSRLEDAMQQARAMRRGGVGWYPRSQLCPPRYRAGAQLDARRQRFRRAAVAPRRAAGEKRSAEAHRRRPCPPAAERAGAAEPPARDREGRVPRQTPVEHASKPRPTRRATRACRRAAP